MDSFQLPQERKRYFFLRIYVWYLARITIVSYNILSDSACMEHYNELYPYCPVEFLKWTYRKANLLVELRSIFADIVALQVRLSSVSSHFSRKLIFMKTLKKNLLLVVIKDCIKNVLVSLPMDVLSFGTPQSTYIFNKWCRSTWNWTDPRSVQFLVDLHHLWKTPSTILPCNFNNLSERIYDLRSDNDNSWFFVLLLFSCGILEKESA